MGGFMSKATFQAGERKRADYILYFKPNIPIAIIEAAKGDDLLAQLKKELR